MYVTIPNPETIPIARVDLGANKNEVAKATKIPASTIICSLKAKSIDLRANNKLIAKAIIQTTIAILTNFAFLTI